MAHKNAPLGVSALAEEIKHGQGPLNLRSRGSIG